MSEYNPEDVDTLFEALVIPLQATRFDSDRLDREYWMGELDRAAQMRLQAATLRAKLAVQPELKAPAVEHIEAVGLGWAGFGNIGHIDLMMRGLRRTKIWWLEYCADDMEMQAKKRS